jgi:hypothetical protein
MLTSDLGRIIFAVNCFGTFSKEDEDRIVATVGKRIESYVMEKAKLVMVKTLRSLPYIKGKLANQRL